MRKGLQILAVTLAIVQVAPAAFGQLSLNSLTDNPPGISPNLARVGGGSFPLTLNGSGFSVNSVARLGATNLTTTFVNANTLSAVVPFGLIKTTGVQGAVVIDAGVTSNVVFLTVVNRGDANGNGAVNVGDALVLARSAGGLVRPPVPESVGDVNLNDTVSIGDALIAALFTGGIRSNLDTPVVASTNVSGSVSVGTPITLTGSGFSSIPENNVVVFSKSGGGFTSAVAASVLVNADSKTLTVTVPSEVASGPVFVKRADLGLPGQPFRIAVTNSPMPVYISRVDSAVGLSAGITSITINGSGFSSTPANNTITFSAAGNSTVTVAPSAASPTSLMVLVPSQAVGGFVSVNVNGQTSNRKSILVSGTPAPLLVNHVFYSDAPGEPILIEGTGFNVSSPSDNEVLFSNESGGETAGVVVSAGRTEIIALIPAGAAGGMLRVRTGNGSVVSNTFQYASVSDGFAVPSLASMTPPSALAASSVNVTISGTNFVSGQTSITIAGSGVSAGSIVVRGPSSVEATLIVDASAAAGARTVTVTTPGGNSNAITFTVTPRINTLLFLDSTTNISIREVVVTEGNVFQVGTRAFDAAGLQRENVTINFASSNPEVAVVTGTGNIQGKKAGFSTLTATGGGSIAVATIAVVQVASGSAALDAIGVSQDSTNRIYVAAGLDHTIRTAANVTLPLERYAGISQSPGLRNDLRLNALFRGPSFIAVDSSDGSLYVTDSANNVIRRIQPGPSGRVETVAGTGALGSQDGSLLSAQFNNPQGIVMDSSRNLWVSDAGNHTIRKIDLVQGIVTTIAGLAGNPGSSDGTGLQARFNSPAGIAIESETAPQQLDLFRFGGAPPVTRFIIADSGNGRVRRLRATGEVETIAAAAATSPSSASVVIAADSSPPLRFDRPIGIAVDPLGNIYVTEPDHGIKAILRNGTVVDANQANTVRGPRGVAITSAGKVVVTDRDHSLDEINFGKPQIDSVDPQPLSGARVTVRGKNFAPESIVIASGALVTDFDVRDTETIVLTVPPIPNGGIAASLTVLNRGGLQGILTSDLTLRAADTPHTLSGNLLVSPNITLALEPGVTLRAERNTVILVSGLLVARGTAVSPIRFTSRSGQPQAGDWGGIVFTDTSVDAQYDGNGNYVSGSILENVVIEYAGADLGGNSYGLYLADAAPWVNQSVVRNNRGTGIGVNLGMNRVASPRITSSTITNNGMGVWADYSTNVFVLEGNTVSDNGVDGVVVRSEGGTGTILNNVMQRNGREGLRSESNAGPLRVQNNRITDNQRGIDISFNLGGDLMVVGNLVQNNRPLGGMYVSAAGAVTISRNTVIFNAMESGIASPYYDSPGGTGMGGGLLMGGFPGYAPVIVTNNIFANNTAAEDGGGIYLNLTEVHPRTPATIANNVFAGNVAPKNAAARLNLLQGYDYYFTANTVTQNRSTAPAGAVISANVSATLTASQNNWFNNVADYTLNYLNANTSPALNAADNWWGTANESAIQSLIYDFSDDGSRGVVAYAVALTSASISAPISPPSGVQVTAGNGTLSLQWNANPESDRAGYKVYYTTAGYPYTGTGAAQGASPIDVGNVTSFTLTGLPAGIYNVTITAYDTGRDNQSDQLDGNESWFAPEEKAIVGGASTDASFTLTVAVAGSGRGAVASQPAGIVCGFDCSQAYVRGTTVVLTASTSANSTFIGWSGACSGIGTCQITMTSNQSVTATFTQGTSQSGNGVSGELTTTTWRVSDSPIRVVGNVRIPQGTTLTIEPGVQVLFSPRMVLTVSGTLIARGTEAAPIRFTSAQSNPQPGDWGYIVFTDTSVDAQLDANRAYVAGSIIERSIIEYAGADIGAPGTSSALQVFDASPFFNAVTIQQNRQFGMQIEFNPVQRNSARVTNSTIRFNAGGLQANFLSNSLSLEGNTVSDNSGVGLILTGADLSVINNTIANNLGPGLQSSATATIADNRIVGNGQGIYQRSFGSSSTITRNLVQGNSLGGGITAYDGGVVITGNIILNNKKVDWYQSADAVAGAGINYHGWPERREVTILNNVIAGNIVESDSPFAEAGGAYIGPTIDGATDVTVSNNVIVNNVAARNSALTLRKVASGNYTVTANTITQNRSTKPGTAAISLNFPDSLTLTQNNWFNNSTAYTLEYANVNTAPILNAPGNWWGTADAATIRSLIYDFFRDGSRGVVTAATPLTSPNASAPISPPSGFTVTAGAGSLTINWNANPEGDKAGYKVYYSTTGFPYAGSGATQGLSPIDVGNVTNYTLTGLGPGRYSVAITAYDASRDNVNDQTDGNESWFSIEETAIVGGGTTSPSATLTVTKAGAGKGTVVSSLAGITCGNDCSQAFAQGTTVILTASTDTSSAFTGWSGACTGTGTCSVVMSSDKSATATFADTSPSQGNGVNGILSTTTWRLADSPIQITGNTFVPQGATLTIEAGVNVMVASGKVLVAAGTLVARGTAVSPIRFTSRSGQPQAGDWGGIVFTDTSVDAQYDGNGNYVSGSILENVVIEYAGADLGGNSYGLYLADAAPWVNQSVVRNNRGTGIGVNLGMNRVASPRITSSTITNNGMGVWADYSTNVFVLEGNTVSDNGVDGVVVRSEGGTGTILNNVMQRNGREGLRSESNAGPLRVQNNRITDNQRGIDISFNLGGDLMVVGNLVQNNRPLGGMYVSAAGAVTISRNTVIFNAMESGIASPYYDSPGGTGMGGGLLMGGFPGYAPVIVTNNIFANNTAAEDGGGIYLNLTEVHPRTPATIANNVFAGNVAPKNAAARLNLLQGYDYYFTANTVTQNRSTAPAGAVISANVSATLTASQNNWFNNVADYTLNYLNANTSPALNAADNWWGTANESAIQSLIYDFSDDGSRGVVAYAVALTSASISAPISPPSGVQVTAGNGTLSLQWNANPESDRAGYKVYYTTAGYPYTGTGAAQGASPIDVGNVTSFTLTGLPAGIYNVTITAYDTGRDNQSDQLDGNESWFAQPIVATVAAASNSRR